MSYDVYAGENGYRSRRVCRETSTSMVRPPTLRSCQCLFKGKGDFSVDAVALELAVFDRRLEILDPDGFYVANARPAALREIKPANGGMPLSSEMREAAGMSCAV
jgi:hypothetical protein